MFPVAVYCQYPDGWKGFVPSPSPVSVMATGIEHKSSISMSSTECPGSRQMDLLAPESNGFAPAPSPVSGMPTE